MSTNRLCLNTAKTQLIWFGTRQQLAKLDFLLLTEKFPAFTYSSSVRDLGVTLDSSLTFTEHVSNLTRSCFFQLRRLRAIRRSVSPSIFTTIVHAFVCSRLDYCNSLLMGLPVVNVLCCFNQFNALVFMTYIPRQVINNLSLSLLLSTQFCLVFFACMVDRLPSIAYNFNCP